jgi:hypothetical protein
MDTNSASLLAALEVASGPNYLGSIPFVDSVLRNLAMDALRRRQEMSCEEATERDWDDCCRLGRIFLGGDPGFTPVPTWNCENHIDQFLARELGWTGRKPLEITRGVFVKFLVDFYNLVSYANTPGVQEYQYDFQFEGIFEFYRNLLIGVPLSATADETATG